MIKLYGEVVVPTSFLFNLHQNHAANKVKTKQAKYFIPLHVF
jgi:hypothetical protein